MPKPTSTPTPTSTVPHTKVPTEKSPEQKLNEINPKAPEGQKQKHEPEQKKQNETQKGIQILKPTRTKINIEAALAETDARNKREAPQLLEEWKRVVAENEELCKRRIRPIECDSMPIKDQVVRLLTMQLDDMAEVMYNLEITEPKRLSSDQVDPLWKRLVAGYSHVQDRILEIVKIRTSNWKKDINKKNEKQEKQVKLATDAFVKRWQDAAVKLEKLLWTMNGQCEAVADKHQVTGQLANQLVIVSEVMSKLEKAETRQLLDSDRVDPLWSRLVAAHSDVQRRILESIKTRCSAGRWRSRRIFLGT